MIEGVSNDWREKVYTFGVVAREDVNNKVVWEVTANLLGGVTFAS